MNGNFTASSKHHWTVAALVGLDFVMNLSHVDLQTFGRLDLFVAQAALEAHIDVAVLYQDVLLQAFRQEELQATVFALELLFPMREHVCTEVLLHFKSHGALYARILVCRGVTGNMVLQSMRVDILATQRAKRFCFCRSFLLFLMDFAVRVNLTPGGELKSTFYALIIFCLRNPHMEFQIVQLLEC